MDAEKYIYETIRGPASCRFLKLKPQESAVAGIPHLSIQEYPLAEAPAYCALSYTWGKPDLDPPGAENRNDEDDDFLVRIEGKALAVTRNLFDALQRLMTAPTDVWHWIDAICINQDDTQERSSQVSMMGDIYVNAFYVIVWLGKDMRDSGQALALVNRLAAVPPETAIASRTSPSNFVMLPTLQNLGVSDIIRSKLDWLPLIRFFEKSWFRRTWVLQELALANSVAVFWGAETVDWNIVSQCAGTLVKSLLSSSLGTVSEHYSSTEMRPEIGSSASDLSTLRLLCQGQAESNYFHKFMVQRHDASQSVDYYVVIAYLHDFTKFHSATVAQDKVFALLGIAGQICRAMKIPFTPMYPDYEMTPQATFTELSRRSIEGVLGLSFLSYLPIPPQHKVTGLQSWAPDFASAGGPPLILSTGVLPLPFDASRCTTQSELGYHFIGDRLHAFFHDLGDITCVTAPGSDMISKGDFETFATLIMSMSPEYRYTGQVRMEAFWRTMCVDSFSGHCPARPEMQDCFSAWVARILVAVFKVRIQAGGNRAKTVKEMAMVEKLAKEDCSGLILPLEQLITYSEKLGILEDRLSADARKIMWSEADTLSSGFGIWAAGIQHKIYFRRMFTTSTGYVGLGPGDVRVGDSAVVFSGAPMPFVMRRTVEGEPKVHELVGEAYVHGAMRGEIFAGEGPEWKPVGLD